uniref:Phenylalanine--tRNA ligase beta subunit, chloroplastic n=1 Tax=Tryblionella apiculata TaxID=1003145 RepID=A0A8F0WGT2_9STRA|nr:phenylalanine tRNA synthetase [Tryblionella apiculata]QWM93501.1 phenylalanine tRNA synthetase [Tryblionella apiculata]
MQISLKWVNELVNIEDIELNDLINKLTLGGFEVEEILEIEINNQKIITLDISATANRSDSLSIQGLSLEIAALLNKSPKILNCSTRTFSWLQQIKKLSENSLITKECSGFISITVENLSNLLPPKWLKDKLTASGLTPENNLADFQNYIILETGYPFEFYDLEKIYLKSNQSELNLKLMTANDSEKFHANNGIEYNLNQSILVLKANDIPLSIAGIISSNDTNYSNNTNSLLIEGSIFNAGKIRQQSRTLGLRTTRSSRYEKSLKNTNLLESFYRLICLLRIENPNLICKLHTIAQSSQENIRTISLNYKNIKQVLGPITKTNNKYNYISPEIITNALERLQFQTHYDEQNQIWKVTVPPLRSDDIILEIDLIEEIGRIYGFNNFLTRLPNIKRIGIEDFHYQTRKKLISCFINLGLNELIQYSLVNKETHLINEIELINPLVKDYSNLRISLLPNLLKAIEENTKNGNPTLEGFEYGHIFSGDSLKNLKEKEYIAGVFGGVKIKSSWSEPSKLLDWFEAKGRIEQLFKKLNLVTYWKSDTSIKENNILHPYRTASIYIPNGKKLGIFGQVHPILAKSSGISNNLYLFEFDFELIQNQIQINKLSIYQNYSSYPKIIKDLSFIIQNDISFNNLQEILYLNGSKVLNDINLLDEYSGKSIPKNHTSLCVQFIFQSNKETLQNKKVESIIENLKLVLMTKFDAKIRV